jgi:hypothetical protein
MTNSTNISLRIPAEMLAQIDRIAAEKYTAHNGKPNRTLVILDAIVIYLELLGDPVTNSTAAEIRRLVVKQACLEAQLDGMQQFCIEQGYDPIDADDKYTLEGG